MTNHLEIIKKYHLNVGDLKFSPITQASIGLSMQYIEHFNKCKDAKAFLLGFPNKKWATIWLSLGLLNNFFLEDYVYQDKSRLDNLKLVAGDNIEIFGKYTVWKGRNSAGIGKIAYYERVPTSMGRKEKKEYERDISKGWISFVNRDNSKRKRNLTMKALNCELQTRRSNSTALDKILSYSERNGLGINPSLLTSKILIVTGKGDKGRFIKQMKETQIYGAPVDSIFKLEENILVGTDLENYISLFDSEQKKKAIFYKKFALPRLLKIDSSDLSDYRLLTDIVSDIRSDRFCTEEYIERFDELIEDLGDDHALSKLLSNLRTKMHPGVKNTLPKNLRVVIINDYELVIHYKETINGFLKAGIPVIVMGDKANDFSDKEKYSNFFRLDWNQNKIQAMKAEAVEYLDSELWRIAQKYSKQKISIIVFEEPNGFENGCYHITNAVYKLEGFELFKRSYWDHLFPIFSWIKNTPGEIAPFKVTNRLLAFNKTYSKQKKLLPDEISTSIDLILSKLAKGFSNRKNIADSSLIFSQKVKLGNSKLIIPFRGTSKMTNVRYTDDKTEEITFLGEPYREKYFKHLNKACLVDFVEKIEILCWPSEAKKVNYNLKNSYLKGCFSDNLPTSFGFSENHLSLDGSSFSAEKIISFTQKIKVTSLKQSLLFEVDEFEMQQKFRHSGYISKDHVENVKSRIVNLRMVIGCIYR